MGYIVEIIDSGDISKRREYRFDTYAAALHMAVETALGTAFAVSLLDIAANRILCL